MPRRKNTLLSCSLLLLLIACLAVLAGGFALVGLPVLAERAFGPPNPTLAPLDRIYLSARLLLVQDSLTRPSARLRGQQAFEVGLGEPAALVANRLQQEGAIANSQAFLTFLHYSGLDTTLQAGKFNLTPGMTPIDIARQMQDATPTEVTFHILPGWRMEEIAQALPTSGLEFSAEEFRQAASVAPADHPLAAEIPAGSTLEGFFLPDAYTVARVIRPAEFVRLLLDNFQARVTPDLRQGFAEQGLHLYQAVTLASMVEREAVQDEEMPMIASVFHNRLAAGMKLDSDPTVQYALGYDAQRNTWWKNPLSLDDLQVDSPYNTYRYTGLPPGPIASPSLEALKAVAFPAKTPYFYFRAACDGSGRHTFAESLEEHVENACP